MTALEQGAALRRAGGIKQREAIPRPVS